MADRYLFTWDDALGAWVFVDLWGSVAFLVGVKNACGPRAELTYLFRVFELTLPELDRVHAGDGALPPDLLAAANAAREASR